MTGAAEDPLIDLLEGIRTSLDTLAEAVEHNSSVLRQLTDMQGRAYAVMVDICNLMATDRLDAGIAVQLLKLVLQQQGAKIDNAHIARAAQERLAGQQGREFIAALAELERILADNGIRSRNGHGDERNAADLVRMHENITSKNNRPR